MKKLRFLMPVGFLLISGVIGITVMLLWNWLMPAIFGLVAINFWQALGLFALARILFGGFAHGKRKRNMLKENLIRKKWMNMTPEQRKEFIEKRDKFCFGRPFNRRGFGMDEYEESEKGDE
ncbi:MAG: hypothetical protein LBQ84_06605 [Flavobacteriaceae bacterium]|nr:hypothetical protein [Flavobacteriaceae bacterium]